MQLITVPNICPVAVAVAVVVVVARAFVDEVDFMEILCRTRRTDARADATGDEEWSQLGPNVFFRRR